MESRQVNDDIGIYGPHIHRARLKTGSAINHDVFGLSPFSSTKNIFKSKITRKKKSPQLKRHSNTHTLLPGWYDRILFILWCLSYYYKCAKCCQTMTNIAASPITIWFALFCMCFYRFAFFELLLFILYFYIVAYILSGPYMLALIKITLNFVVQCYKDSIVFNSILFYSLLFVLRIAGFICPSGKPHRHEGRGPPW